MVIDRKQRKEEREGKEREDEVENRSRGRNVRGRCNLAESR